MIAYVALKTLLLLVQLGLLWYSLSYFMDGDVLHAIWALLLSMYVQMSTDGLERPG